MPNDQSPMPLPFLSPLSPPPAAKKKPWKSKTLWTNALLGLLMLHPRVGAFVSQYPSSVALGVALANFLLRFLSHGKISLED